MFTKALLEVSYRGLGKFGKTSIFPCGIFQCMKGVNRAPGDPNYDLFKLALKSTAQRLYPNYVNVDWSTNAGYDKNDPNTYVSTMGCRTYNGADINAEPGTNPQTKDGRGNIAPVTILLPFLAMEARENAVKNKSDAVDEFMKLLDIKLHEARDMLKERFEWICSQSPASAQFMYENGTMLGYKPEEGIRSDENGGLYRHTRHYKGDKDSDSLNAIYPYIMTLEKICDKGLDITERLSNHLIQNIGLNPKEY